jgi:hypothetical protein
LAAILLVRPALKVRRRHSLVELQQPFQKPLEYAVATAFAIWFVGPWVEAALHLEVWLTVQRWMSAIVQWGRGL